MGKLWLNVSLIPCCGSWFCSAVLPQLLPDLLLEPVPFLARSGLSCFPGWQLSQRLLRDVFALGPAGDFVHRVASPVQVFCCLCSAVIHYRARFKKSMQSGQCGLETYTIIPYCFLNGYIFLPFVLHLCCVIMINTPVYFGHGAPFSKQSGGSFFFHGELEETNLLGRSAAAASVPWRCVPGLSPGHGRSPSPS